MSKERYLSDEEELFFDVADKGIDSVVFVIEKTAFLRHLKRLELSQKLRLITRNQAIKG
ncbi:hypothetical protein [Campylobacter ureolyticus]|uniref:Uncharacterized protein n=1 Tax=Campylobacter ureolyticus TaxID=827 RepID=A0A9Q4PXW0_9BACT|nr:hypothetical protein [Campylobacter ureolyticus]MCZ6104036.1 hypothetical protein [Campylobacter ureolyticus]MCZ6135459.1 hypothetical protein [Campylobacter ureolyticus]MCZ6162415.1 hypothetical protein [Campylobacter ureolyticus]MCZ6171340.1 hypothetical protein [Campylobacter ureolyticus]MDU4981556.1 hypothetical protein [Campylobacter ureolyticus]